MKVFHCDHCGQFVFFENSHCVTCGHLLAYLPELADVGSLERIDDTYWMSRSSSGPERNWRLCANYVQENVCNWAVSADDPQTLCRSCRLTQVIPDLGTPGKKAAWYRLETAKRRLLYTLFDLKLPVVSQADDPENGLVFEFLSNGADGQPALSGHANGRITINVAEADDSERERRRNMLDEPYRTLLGHFRHEIGHYYWDRLIAGTDKLEGFRATFGDESVSYQEALNQHYQQGAPGDWQQRFISAYASCHPWEDWAETWAHYLHMRDVLETAAVSGLTLKPRDRQLPKVALNKPPEAIVSSFDGMIDAWFPLTYVINNLNRGLGLPDGYPFVLSTPVIEKLRFIHDVVTQASVVSELPKCADVVPENDMASMESAVGAQTI